MSSCSGDAGRLPAPCVPPPLPASLPARLAHPCTLVCAAGFTHGLTVKFADAAHLPVYANHAEHLKVVNDHIAPIREETMALDYVENKW